MNKSLGALSIGGDNRVFVIAEVSANHNNDLNRALEIVRAAAEAGADAIKLQTYTPDTLTIKSDREEFRVTGTIWEKETLYSLFEKAHLPWEWHRPLFEEAARLGMRYLSTPFDFTAVDFLEDLGVDLYKIASSEVVDLPLIKRVAGTGKPVLLSTGMATREEIQEAITTLRENGSGDICVLKCTAAYPAQVADANLRSLARIPEFFGAIPGLSDHTMPETVPVVATALGAKVIEKHITLDRSAGGPDAEFSLEPEEFARMVAAVREAEAALGVASFEPTAGEMRTRDFRRSLYVVEDIAAGELFSAENVRSIRPAAGLHTRHYEAVLGTPARVDIDGGTPLSAEMLTVPLAQV
ncbi:pseudaminic acid synthase [Palleronia caenipelagi]|uniref:Pseudaminic acid synthase n=2 Tax=Palleronia caenipelagi TaxID=2489174 RepID=A0A547PLC4_9RHOB|nr:pseudaminic acid synthase [Palleronia caenipelagi]